MAAYRPSGFLLTHLCMNTKMRRTFQRRVRRTGGHRLQMVIQDERETSRASFVHTLSLFRAVAEANAALLTFITFTLRKCFTSRMSSIFRISLIDEIFSSC